MTMSSRSICVFALLALAVPALGQVERLVGPLNYIEARIFSPNRVIHLVSSASSQGFAG